MEGLEGMTYIKHPKRGVKELWNFRIEIPANHAYLRPVPKVFIKTYG
jgi:hypothetical protein|tara:strand:- start:1717 stop:1857 length:141 start_codon:yes stop_codon:yes gene_type:complete